MIKQLIDLLERFVVAHEHIAEQLEILALRGSSYKPIYTYDKGKDEGRY